MLGRKLRKKPRKARRRRRRRKRLSQRIIHKNRSLTLYRRLPLPFYLMEVGMEAEGVGHEVGGEEAQEVGMGWHGTGERRSGRGMWLLLVSRVVWVLWVLERTLVAGEDMGGGVAGRGEVVLVVVEDQCIRRSRPGCEEAVSPS
jgi:hypothetical protein